MKKRTAIILITCLLVVIFWQVMAGLGRRPFDPFKLTGEDFKGFMPVFADYSVSPALVRYSNTDPNIMAFEMKVKSLTSRQVDKLTSWEDNNNSSANSKPVNLQTCQPVNSMIRLVHGYNMVDCMRLKGYTVEEVASRPVNQSQEARFRTQQYSVVSNRNNPADSENDSNAKPDNLITCQPVSPSLQVWRLVSETGNRSIWLTSMISYPGLEPTDVDTRDMQFPRVGDPADSRVPIKGITRESLKSPWRSFRSFIGAKWNNSRKDILVFLGLKRPAWASDELLTLVTCSKGIDIKPEQEQAVISQLTEQHFDFLRQLKSFKKK